MARTAYDGTMRSFMSTDTQQRQCEQKAQEGAAWLAGIGPRPSQRYEPTDYLGWAQRVSLSLKRAFRN